MRTKLVFATNNAHKLEEVKAITKDLFEIVSLKDINCFDDIPETADTLEGNALLKARYIKEKFGFDCFADDTGLEIEALNNEPGVYSARYAGEECNSQANMDKVLSKMKGINNRKARFRTVFALISDNKEYLCEGRVDGLIREEKSGAKGFGYDPIFQPEGYDITFAEMSQSDKNEISHRGRGMKKLIELLNELSN